MAGKPQWYSSASAFAILWQIQQNPKMTHWLPSLSAACCLWAAFGPGLPALAQNARLPREVEVDAEQFWRRVLLAIDQHASVECKLYEEVHLYDQHLIGRGTYLQGPPGYHWSRLELAVKVNEHDAIVNQRCDGDRLMVLRSRDGLPQMTSVDVKRVLAAARAGQRDRSGAPRLGIGGLPKLFDALDKGFRFTDVRQHQLEKRPVYVLKGEWEPARLLRWLPEQKEALESGGPVDLSKLPPPIPDQVLIVVDAKDLFPRRIEYRRAAIDGKKKTRTLLLLSLSKIVFDQPVERHSFVFENQALPVRDETDAYIINLGLFPVPQAASAAPAAAWPSAAGPTR